MCNECNMSGSGGILNLISQGNNNKIILGNPSINSFRAKYVKTRNFGKQAFRLDYDGSRDIRLTESSTFQFTVKNYAELLLDTFLCINLPDIWSPIYHPSIETGMYWAPYDFRWIEDIGSRIIEEIVVTTGAMIIGKYSGSYLSNIVERDFTAEKKELYKRATGNVKELNDPANAFSRMNTYPSAYYVDPLTGGAEPSIRGRQLFIPINTWFTLDSKCAFPLIAQQYNELVITVTLRPIQELFCVRDVFDYTNNYPYVQPDFNKPQFAMYRYLQTPPSIDISPEKYDNTIQIWNADVHLICDYVFLSEEDTREFANSENVYLVRDVYEYLFENVVGSKKVQLLSNGLVSNWMFYFQRNDVNLRNEWCNYTNFPYNGLPVDVQIAPTSDLESPFDSIRLKNIGPGVNADDTNTGIFITGAFSAENQKEILQTMAIVLDGNYRENSLTSGYWNYVDKYRRSSGGARDGLYFYNFGLDTGNYQPTGGAINLSRFRIIEYEFTTYVPPIDNTKSNEQIVCDLDGNPIAFYKSNWRLYDYTYNLVVQEERYNVLSFIGGYCGLMYAR